MDIFSYLMWMWLPLLYYVDLYNIRWCYHNLTTWTFVRTSSAASLWTCPSIPTRPWRTEPRCKPLFSVATPVRPSKTYSWSTSHHCHSESRRPAEWWPNSSNAIHAYRANNNRRSLRIRTTKRLSQSKCVLDNVLKYCIDFLFGMPYLISKTSLTHTLYLVFSINFST